MLDFDRLVDCNGLNETISLPEIHRQRVEEAISTRRLIREAIWTESIAVGSEFFLEEIVSGNHSRKNMRISRTIDGSW
jgi:hypothetical protein